MKFKVDLEPGVPGLVTKYTLPAAFVSTPASCASVIMVPFKAKVGNVLVNTPPLATLSAYVYEVSWMLEQVASALFAGTMELTTKAPCAYTGLKMICSAPPGTVELPSMRSTYQPNAPAVLPEPHVVVLPCQQIATLVPSIAAGGAPLTTVEALGVKVWACRF